MMFECEDPGCSVEFDMQSMSGLMGLSCCLEPQQAGFRW
jgi:hypothetical protein